MQGADCGWVLHEAIFPVRSLRFRDAALSNQALNLGRYPSVSEAVETHEVLSLTRVATALPSNWRLYSRHATRHRSHLHFRA